MNGHFYVLNAPYARKYLLYGDEQWVRRYGLAEWGNGPDFVSIVCPKYPGHQRPGKRIGNLNIILPSPRLGDFVWTWYHECIVQRRTLNLFKEAGVTGFEIRPVTVERVNGLRKGTPATSPELFELWIIGQGGHAHPDSGIRLMDHCPYCGWTKYSSFRAGLGVDPAQWDGSDMFRQIEYRGFIIVTEKVKEIIVSNHLTNCTLTPVKDLEWGPIPRPEDPSA